MHKSIHDADRTIQPVDCPECNGRPNVLTAGKHYYVRCPNCGACVGEDSDTPEAAIETWNRAAMEIVAPEDVEWDSIATEELE